MNHLTSLRLVGYGATILLVLLMIGGNTTFNTGTSCKKEFLCVYFLDVGQGDATFIVSPSGEQVLIDGGPDSSVLRELGSVMGYFDRNIDLVVATHPDRDHIGGLVDVFDRYKIERTLFTENKNDTPAAEQFLERVNREGVSTYARTGQEIVIGYGPKGTTTLSVLFPDRDPTFLESNTSSIILRLVYGDTEFLFTGDSPQSIEEYLVKLYGNELHSDVLKVGHHGSRTSTDETFLQAIDPEYAVISSGSGNSYGHPHKEVMTALVAQGSITKNTAEDGRVVFLSDGTRVESR